MNLRKLQEKQTALEKLHDLKGKYVLLTGRIPKYTRITIEKEIADRGGLILSRPETFMDVIVYTRMNTTKYQTAERLSKAYPGQKMQFVTGSEFLTNYLKLE